MYIQGRSSGDVNNAAAYRSARPDLLIRIRQWTYIQHTHTCICEYIYVGTYIHTWMHTYIHIYTHTYMHACIHKQTQTHIHTVIWPATTILTRKSKTFLSANYLLLLLLLLLLSFSISFNCYWSTKISIACYILVITINFRLYQLSVRVPVAARSKA